MSGDSASQRSMGRASTGIASQHSAAWSAGAGRHLPLYKHELLHTQADRDTKDQAVHASGSPTTGTGGRSTDCKGAGSARMRRHSVLWQRSGHRLQRTAD